jgi:hypothetical protein
MSLPGYDGGSGLCRRYAPRPGESARWAQTDLDMWCGEHTPKEAHRSKLPEVHTVLLANEVKDE